LISIRHISTKSLSVSVDRPYKRESQLIDALTKQLTPSLFSPICCSLLHTQCDVYMSREIQLKSSQGQ